MQLPDGTGDLFSPSLNVLLYVGTRGGEKFFYEAGIRCDLSIQHSWVNKSRYPRWSRRLITGSVELWLYSGMTI
jgi:hypothetical protein